MTRVELQSWLKSHLVNDAGKINPWSGKLSWWETNGRIEVYCALQLHTAFLDESAATIERVVCILQGIVSKPVCVCGKATSYFAKYKGFAQFCSVGCSSSSEEVKTKVIATNREKFGADYNLQTAGFRAKSLATLREKYGVDNAAQSAEVQAKTKATNLERYGAENPSHSPTIKERISRALISDQSYQTLTNRGWLIDQHHIQQKPLCQIAKEVGVSECIIPRYLAAVDVEQRYYLTSQQDHEIAAYIRPLVPDVEVANRSALPGFEIDVYCPSKTLGIEHHGLYWHSFASKETSKQIYAHQHKAFAARRAKIRLFQIFGSEWVSLTKKQIWQSMIENFLGISSPIQARKCTIDDVFTDQKNKFLDEHHLQGSSPSSINLGLFYQGELISLMTFVKPRFNKAFDFELARFVTRRGYRVIGGASRLFATFLKRNQSAKVITYSDLRYATGDLYKNLGFDYAHTTAPNYFYFKNNEDKLYSRLKFQKHKLSGLLENFDPCLTEAENMFANGYRRIWDCGNLVFSYSK